MRKVYVIQCNQIMPEFGVERQHHGMIDFAFSSFKKANDQMDVIHRMVDEGKFYTRGNHEVAFDKSFDDDRLNRVLRINHSNGTFTILSIHSVCLNSGYCI